MSKLAGLGVIVGAAALFIVLCGFNGLRDYSLDIKFTALLELLEKRNRFAIK